LRKNQVQLSHKKKTQEEVHQLIEKLHKDAQERKVKKDSNANNKEKLKEMHHLYYSEDDLTTNASKLKILEKFVQMYELALLNLFNKKDSLLINFDEFCNLMLALGFVKYDHGNHVEEENVSENDKKKKEKERALLNNAWKILSNTNINIENNEEENHNDERIDTNQLLVFCASLLGLYKGEDSISVGQNSVINSEEKHELIVNTNPTTTDVNTNENIPKKSSPINKKTDDAKRSPNKKQKLPNRFSTPIEHQKHFETTSSFNMNATLQKPKNPSDPNRNLLKTVIPELDITKYYYLKKQQSR